MIRILALLPLLWLLPACGGDEPAAFTVAGVSYTESELLGLSESRRELLAELTAFAAIIAEGRTEEFVEPWVDSARAARMWQQIQAERILDEEGVGDAVLETRYRTSPDFELTVRHLIVFADRYQTDEVRAEAQAKARSALDRIRAGEPFPQVAAEVSDEPGAESREGLLNPGRKGAWVSEFWTAANALEVGEISGVVETQYGFHVLRLEDRDTLSFAEARPGVAVEVAGLITPLDRPQPSADSVRALAAALGYAPTDDAFEEVLRRQVIEVEAQAQLLGLPLTLPAARVKEAALAALAARGQNAELARDLVHAWRPQLERIHPIPERLAAESETVAGSSGARTRTTTETTLPAPA